MLFIYFLGMGDSEKEELMREGPCSNRECTDPQTCLASKTCIYTCSSYLNNVSKYLFPIKLFYCKYILTLKLYIEFIVN